MLTEDISSAEKKRVNILEVALSLNKKQNARFRFFSLSAYYFDVVAGILCTMVRWTEMLFADKIMETG